jgi:hypothetical protein
LPWYNYLKLKNREKKLGKHAGMFKSEKRKKELKRLKKQEEKRQRRTQKDMNPGQSEEITNSEPEPETAAETTTSTEQSAS